MWDWFYKFENNINNFLYFYIFMYFIYWYKRYIFVSDNIVLLRSFVWRISLILRLKWFWWFLIDLLVFSGFFIVFFGDSFCECGSNLNYGFKKLWFYEILC